MNPNILGVIGPGFLNQVPTLNSTCPCSPRLIKVPRVKSSTEEATMEVVLFDCLVGIFRCLGVNDQHPCSVWLCFVVLGRGIRAWESIVLVPWLG